MFCYWFTSLVVCLLCWLIPVNKVLGEGSSRRFSLTKGIRGMSGQEG